MNVPTDDPHDRGQVPAADSYRRGDRVWVHRHGAWQPGVVENASAGAVMVTYRRTGERGQMVDTLTATYVMPRDEIDPQLDANGASS